MTIPFIQPDVKPSVNELRLDLAFFFPEITHFYGYASKPDHNTRRCLDAMVYDSSKKYVTQQGRNNLGYADRIALGGRMLAFLRENADHYGINGLIWNGKVYGFPHAGGTNNYRGPYNVARNYTLSQHDDHIHIDQDGSTFKPLRDAGAPFPLGTVWVDVLVPGVTNSISIRLVQRALGVEQTGTWDAATLAAAKAYQASLGDTVQDGLLGPKQVTKLFADKGMSVTVRLDASGQAPKPPVVKPDPKPEPPAVSHFITYVFNNPLWNNDSRGGGWDKRKAGLVKQYLSAKPDVIGVCEIDPDQAADIAKLLGDGWSYWRIRGGNKYGPLALYWRQSTMERRANADEHEFSDNDSRYLLSLPLVHKASGETVTFDVTHLENNGSDKVRAGKRRKLQGTEIAQRTKTGKRIGGGDLNSTTPAMGLNGDKPRVIMGAAGLRFLSDQEGVKNRQYASHHSNLTGRPKGAWIDDQWFRGVTFVRGEMILTSNSDHHILAATYKL